MIPCPVGKISKRSSSPPDDFQDRKRHDSRTYEHNFYCFLQLSMSDAFRFCPKRTNGNSSVISELFRAYTSRSTKEITGKLARTNFVPSS